MYRRKGAMSLAGPPKDLIENPELSVPLGAPQPAVPGTAGAPAPGDALSDMLRAIRLTGSLQFCFVTAGEWQTDDKPALASLAAGPSSIIPFHIVVEGSCWLKVEGQAGVLGPGDVVAFPFCTGHQLGVGSGGPEFNPTSGLPPKPWRTLPVVRHGDDPPSLRLLCGYLQCDSLGFRPLRSALPTLLHARSAESPETAWLKATIDQIVAEVDRPRSGGLSMLERLTEITFIELLRHQIAVTRPAAAGLLAALADPALGRCLAFIHEDPRRDWSVAELSAASGLSRSALTERFETILGTSPIRYLRDWRLCLASVALSTTARPIAAIAEAAGYGTEAAFNRAFSRLYGTPPGAWRQSSRQQAG